MIMVFEKSPDPEAGTLYFKLISNVYQNIDNYNICTQTVMSSRCSVHLNMWYNERDWRGESSNNEKKKVLSGLSMCVHVCVSVKWDISDRQAIL